MKRVALGGAIGAVVLAGAPVFAETQNTENQALVRAGCLSASDANPAKLKRRTAIRCFQKARGEAATGTLTSDQKQALLAGEISPSAPQASASEPEGAWRFADNAALFYDPTNRFSIVLNCAGEQLKLMSIASNVRAGNAVTLKIGTSSFDAVVDEGHLPMNKAVEATFSGQYDQHLERLTSAAHAGGVLTIKWPATLRTVSTRGLAESLESLRPVCRGKADVDLLLLSESGDQRLYDAALAKGPAGLPSLTTDTAADAAVSENRKKAWEAYGFEFREIEGEAFVASIREDSPAFLRGLRVGDVVLGDSISGFKGGGMQGLHRTMSSLADYAESGIETRPWTLTINRPSQKVTLEFTIPEPNAAPTQNDILAANAPTLPQTLRDIEYDATMLALWRHQITAISTADEGDAVMRTLFALSYHIKACFGPDPVVIPFQIIMTEVARNGFGRETSRQTTNFDKTLKVRPEFEALARRNLRFFSDNTMNDRFVAVRDLISQEGCDGRSLKWLEAGLAKAAGR